MVQHYQNYTRILYKDILYVQKMQRSIQIVTDRQGNFKDNRGIKELFSEIDDPRFIFTDRAYFVNLDYVQELDGSWLVLTNEDRVPISRPMMPSVKKAMIALWGGNKKKVIYQIVDWAATYIECFVLLAAIAQISGKKLAGIKHILLLCLFSLTDCILVATLNSIQSFSFLTPIASILFCFFVSAGFSTGKVALRAAACIMTVFVILAIGYIWMIFVCIFHGGRFEDAFLDFMTPGPLRCLYLVLDKSTDIAIYLIFRTRLHRLSTLKNRWLVSLLVGSAFAYGVTQYLMNAILSHDIHTMRQASIVSFLVLLLFFLVFSLLLLTISARDQERAQRLVLQQTDRLMEKNYQTLHQDLQGKRQAHPRFSPPPPSDIGACRTGRGSEN